MSGPRNLAVVMTMLWLSGCTCQPESQDDAGQSDAAVDAGGTDAGARDAGTGDAGGCGPSGTYGGGETTTTGGSVTATIVDQDGAPVANQPVYICGIDLCSPPGKTSSSGQVTISTTLSMKRPAFKVGDALTYAELAIPLTAASTTFGTLATAKLPATGAALSAGTSATSGPVTITIPAGASVSIDALTYSAPADQALRVAQLPLAQDAAVFSGVRIDGHAADFALVYGLSPAETLICPKAKLSITLPHATSTPNDLGWAPGAGVELWVMTTDTGQTWAPYAGWAKLSDGVVSADGTSLSTSDGQGVGFLQTFAVRLK